MVIIPSNQRTPHERHTHRCTLAANGVHYVADEPNAVCQKYLRGTGLEFHTFPCMAHIADWRARFGLDALVDTYLDMEQARRMRHEWPNQRVAEREQREAESNPDMRATIKEPGA